MSDTITIGGHEASLTGSLDGVEAGPRLDGRVTVALRNMSIWVIVRQDAGRDEPDLHNLAESLGFKVTDRANEHVRFVLRTGHLAEADALPPVEAVDRLSAWVAAWDGKPTGIPEGEHSGYAVTRKEGAYWVRCDKALVNTLKRIDGAGTFDGGCIVPFRSEDALRKVIERGSKAAKKGEGFQFLKVSGIDVSVDGSVISISFPYDARLVAGVRELPGAKWNAQTKCWTLNVRQREKVQAWLEDRVGAKGAAAQAARDAEAAKAERLAREEAERNERLAREREVGRAALGALELAHSRISISGNSCVVYSRYDEGLVAAFRGMRGKWSDVSRSWTVDLAHGAELAKALLGAEPRLAASAAAAEAEKAANPSIMFLQDRVPSVGETFRLENGTAVTCTRHSKPRWISEDEGDAFHSSEFWSQWVVYAYYRAATPEEAAALADREGEQARARDIRRAVENLRHRISEDGEPFDLGREPDGEILWENARNALYGTRYWVVLDDEGFLWNVTYDGSDGAAWGTYNLGYNTRGRRMKATPEMIGTLREAAEIDGFKTRRSEVRA